MQGENRGEPKTITVPEAGQRYYGLGRNGSYEAAKRGDIPVIQVGRLLRVPIAAMERKLTAPFEPIGDAAQRVVESCAADIRDHGRRMQRELDRQRETEKE